MAFVLSHKSFSGGRSMSSKRRWVERTKDWEQLKALGLEAYAPRSRGRPEALQGVLFSYLEAL